VAANPLEKDKRLAYYHAGVAVVGVELGVSIQRLSIRRSDGSDPTPLLEQLGDWCFEHDSMPAFQFVVIENYCTTLLAGSAGQLQRAEARAGYEHASMEQRAMARRYRTKAVQTYDALTDRAFAIALAGLQPCDGGDTLKSLRRLWLRADYLLRQEPHRSQLNCLATRLLDVEEMFWPEILAVISG
jgi:hypothetical protein